jgi:hypothetical protein
LFEQIQHFSEQLRRLVVASLLGLGQLLQQLLSLGPNQLGVNLQRPAAFSLAPVVTFAV